MPPLNVAFADFEARLGASIIARMANATLTLADGTTTVVGILDDSHRHAHLGMGADAREVEFTVPTSAMTAAPALWADDSTVTVDYRGTVTAYEIGGRETDTALQQVTLMLRRP